MEIKTGRGMKQETLIDFADFVFSKAHRPHDFATLLPKIYGPGRTKLENHVVATDENGMLWGMAMFDPFDLVVGGETLKAACVGTVSAHPRAGGVGIMKKVMAGLDEQEALKNADLVMLGGRRQRYEYYGFTPSGMALRYVIDGNNNRHGLPENTLTLRLLTDEYIQAAMALVHGMDVHVKHDADWFYQVHCSWNARPVVLLDGDKFIGLADVIKEEGRVAQLSLVSNEYAGAAVKALYEDIGKESISFDMGPNDPLNAFFARVAGDMGLSWDANYRIQRFDKVIAAFMKLKHAKTPLEKGAFSLAIEGVGLIKITVDEAGVQVEILESKEKGISKMDACRFFFSSGCGYLPISAPCGWFPLPLFIPHCELC